ncbi:MAG: hypothetical protein RLZZ339_2813 [Cyanobacteriota bacterium]
MSCAPDAHPRTDGRVGHRHLNRTDKSDSDRKPRRLSHRTGTSPGYWLRRLVSEAALLGGVMEKGVSEQLRILSDGAGQ